MRWPKLLRIGLRGSLIDYYIIKVKFSRPYDMACPAPLRKYSVAYEPNPPTFPTLIPRNYFCISSRHELTITLVAYCLCRFFRTSYYAVNSQYAILNFTHCGLLSCILSPSLFSSVITIFCSIIFFMNVLTVVHFSLSV